MDFFFRKSKNKGEKKTNPKKNVTFSFQGNNANSLLVIMKNNENSLIAIRGGEILKF